MTVHPLVRRTAQMDPQEWRFRLGCEIRKIAGRARFRVAPPRWNPLHVGRILAAGHDGIKDARDAAARGDIAGAHRTLARHFAIRTSCWPIRAVARKAFVASLASPRAVVAAATRRADRLLAGQYDLLGYRDLTCGALPDWMRDPVHDRRAPAGFWADVPYLDPHSGDHKVIWELNRHQHWMALGRAYWLTGDPRYRAFCIDQLEDWLAANPPLAGINWASMLELAFRAISWTYALEFFAADEDDPRPWIPALLVALDRQLAHIAQNLSRYFSPNTHLSGEALALYAVSRALPELRQSAQRTAVGRRILIEEATRQIRPDGGHAELSPHYHRYSTDFYLLATLVARASGDPAAATFERAARQQAEYLRTIADDRGCLPQIGDDDGGQLFPFGDARPPDAAPTLAAAAALYDEPSLAVDGVPAEAAWILGAAPRLSIRSARPASWPSRLLPETGYFVSRTREGDHLVFDAGAHGFLNGGHAHADALSITLVVGQTPLFVDPGTGTYTMDLATRDQFRSPRMHNTVVLDRRDFAVPAGPFRWESQADARFLAAQVSPGFDFAQGTHDAFAPARHVRSVAALHTLGWLIVDHVFGDGEHELQAWWHVHPSWVIHRVPAPGATTLRLQQDEGMSLDFATSAQSVRLVTDGPSSMYSPEYGRIERAPVIGVAHRARTPFAIATFVPAPNAGTSVHIEPLAVVAQPDEAFHGAAFAITLERASVVMLVAAPVDGVAPWSGQIWGVEGVLTNARCAASSTAAGATTTIGLADGDALDIGRVASAVHG